MNLFGGAAKFVDFTNSKGGEFVANSDGSKFGYLGKGNRFVEYGKIDPYPYNIPLTLEAIEAGVVITFNNKAIGPVVYKVNNGTTRTITGNATEAITLANVGDKVEFWGDNKWYASSISNYSKITCDKDCYIYGNIMSLIKSKNFESETTLSSGWTFANLFANAHIKNKDTTPLLLPATKLAYNCYQYMFYGCNGLTSAPELPAMTLVSYCYNGMFYNCTSLIKTPELPAIALATECYDSMFYGCTNLSSVTCLATDISEYWCTKDWLKGVAAYGTFTKAASMTGWTLGANGIPSGWLVVDKQ